VVSQFKRGNGGPGICFDSRSGSDTQLGKVCEWSGLKPSENLLATPKLYSFLLYLLLQRCQMRCSLIFLSLVLFVV
jgi:hypothetical protein